MYSGNPTVPGMTCRILVLQSFDSDAGYWDDVISCVVNENDEEKKSDMLENVRLSTALGYPSRLLLRVETVLS